MKTLGGLSIVLIFAAGLFAQNRSGFVNAPPVIRAFPSVTHPAGTSALPGVQRTTGSVLFPGGGAQIGIPAVPFRQGNIFNRDGFGRSGFDGRRYNGGGYNGGGYGGYNGVGVGAYPIAVPVPVYVGGYDDPSAYGYAPQGGPAYPQQAQPNVIVIYPQGPAPVPYGTMPPMQPAMTPPPAQPAEMSESPTHFLLALKDHSIYSAVAYWVDGDTLHYFTTGSTHNEVSLALVDRDLTRRLNEGSGLQIKLPAPK